MSSGGSEILSILWRVIPIVSCLAWVLICLAAFARAERSRRGVDYGVAIAAGVAVLIVIVAQFLSLVIRQSSQDGVFKAWRALNLLRTLSFWAFAAMFAISCFKTKSAEPAEGFDPPPPLPRARPVADDGDDEGYTRRGG